MSGGAACKCSEAKEPLRANISANRPSRLWRVMQRTCNHSAFNGYHETWSAYSGLTCLRCGACWRTRASYVGLLADIHDDEKWICSGYAGHREAMERLGREPCGNHRDVAP